MVVAVFFIDGIGALHGRQHATLQHAFAPNGDVRAGEHLFPLVAFSGGWRKGQMLYEMKIKSERGRFVLSLCHKVQGVWWKEIG